MADLKRLQTAVEVGDRETEPETGETDDAEVVDQGDRCGCERQLQETSP